ncbi:MAG: hypothetical protein IJS39_02925 [Synergistaceae bacterium]|nr:hypothetical protein [Synergistaceae bacterium]
MKLKHFIALFIVVLLFFSSGCGSSSNLAKISSDTNTNNQTDTNTNNNTDTSTTLTSADIEITQTITETADSTNAVLADGETVSYSNVSITKTGDGSGGEDADFYGTNAAVLATNGATLTLTASLVVTDGTYANGVFSYGSGTTVNVKDSVIITSSNNSGGIMTTGGGTMNAENLTIETSGGSSAAIRSDRGGGTVNVSGGSYTTSGTGSPAVYSTADITVSDAYLESKTAQGVVIEGKNSVTLKDSQLVANHNKFNGQDSSYQGIMIYQSGSGDASEGKGEFSITGGSITNANGAVFFVTNTAADITLNDTDIVNNDSEGIMLRAESAAWGSSGSNGGKVNFYAVDQTLTGDFVVDENSALNLYVSGDSVFTGTINGSSEVSSAADSSSSTGQVYVELNDSTWILTGESNITSLTCGTGSVNLNGYALYVNGTAYTSGTASTGTAIDISSGSGDSSGGDSGDDRPTPPDGNTSGDNRPGGNTSGDNAPGGESDTDSGSNDTSMSFANASYTTSTVNNVTYRAYTNLVYVSKPVNETYQRMNVYIPEDYFSGGTINGYTATTAPIFMPNGVGGYSKASAMTPSSSNSVGIALSKGLVVASPALRGRDSDYGTAPACIVDYKAAVRYLRTAGIPAGDTDKIISSGTSAGGAISSLLGATGNSSDYDEWLNELGAASASDDIFASMCYCPITNLDNADGAYEWTFGTESDASEELTANFITYLNGLELGYTLNSDGTGTFADYLESLGISLSTYGATRDKSQIPAFDRLDLSSAENIEFGNAHFTEYGYNHNTASTNAMADSAVIKAMNPMNYIGSATTAKYWRIRHGTEDRDTSLAIPAILALKLQKEGFDVDFAAASGEKHGGDYDLDDLFTWIDEICK